VTFHIRAIVCFKCMVSPPLFHKTGEDRAMLKPAEENDLMSKRSTKDSGWVGTSRATLHNDY